MALEGTHALFAIRMAKVVGAKNLDELISGSVYPDSRCVTGVQRDSTHLLNVPGVPFGGTESDFEKGWALHIEYDEYQNSRFTEIYPEIEDGIQGSSQLWIQISAMKIVEDMNLYSRQGDNVDLLKRIDISSTPRNEDLETLRGYFLLQRSLYSSQPTLESYKKYLEKINLDENTIKSLIDEVNLILLDSDKTSKVLSIFDDAVIDISRKIVYPNK